MVQEFSLYNYQITTVQKLLKLDRSLCALDMGLGKTFVALAMIELWVPKTQVVIVCPKQKLRRVNDHDDSWENMVKTYLDEDYKLPKKYTQTWLDSQKYIVINYDLFHKFNFKKGTYFIFDEIQRAKTATSKIGKAVYFKTKQASKVLMLSGNPFPQAWKDSFNILKIILNENLKYSWFKKKFMMFNNYTGFPVFDGYQNIDQLQTIFNTLGVWMKTEEVIELPPQKFIPVWYENCPEYGEMLTTDVLNLEGKDPIIASIPLAKLTLLRELSSGCIKLSADQWQIFQQNKLTKVENLIESTSEKVIIFYNFFGEKLALLSALDDNLPYYEINGQKNEKDKFIDDRRKCVLLAQYQAASEAIDGLQYTTNQIICYSPTLSGNLWGQMLKRIHRIGQEKTCYYYLLQNELEASIYQNLKELRDYTEESFMSYLWEVKNE